MLIEEKIKKYEKLIKKERASLRKASQARADLGAEVSRKKMTTANARYMSCAEYVDKLESKLDEMKNPECKEEKCRNNTRFAIHSFCPKCRQLGYR